MDWFHCNHCFTQEASGFFVSSCGHIFCKTCAGTDKCLLCGTSCKYLVLKDNMKPDEKAFFKNPAETALKCIAHIFQVCMFQNDQMEQLISFHKLKASESDGALQQALQKLTIKERELEAIQEENKELKKKYLNLKASPKYNEGSRNSTPRPVAITPPSQRVTSHPTFQCSSAVVRRSSSGSHLPNWQHATGALRMTPADSANATPSPTSTQSLFYRASPSSTPSLNIFNLQSSARLQSQSINNNQREGISMPESHISDRIRPIQLRFTPHSTPSFNSRSPSIRNNGEDQSHSALNQRNYGQDFDSAHSLRFGH